MNPLAKLVKRNERGAGDAIDLGLLLLAHAENEDVSWRGMTVSLYILPKLLKKFRSR